MKLLESHKIIVVTGPESTGKTTLATQLSDRDKLPLIPEFAREYLDTKTAGYRYTFEDLIAIGHAQNKMEYNAYQKHDQIVCDTDLVTIDIWAKEKFGRALGMDIPLIEYKHYILCPPDIPWEYDEQRENPDDRNRLFDVYKKYLISIGASYEIYDRK